MQGQAFFDFHGIVPCPWVKYAAARVFGLLPLVNGQLPALRKGKKVNLHLQRRSTFPTYSTATVSFSLFHPAVPTTLLNPPLTFGFSANFFLKLSRSISMSSRRVASSMSCKALRNEIPSKRDIEFLGMGRAEEFPSLIPRY